VNNPLIPASRYRYALGWAATVVDQVAAKYTRDTDIICQIYDINRYDLVKYVAKPDPLWNYFRSRIKALAGMEARLGRQVEYLTIVEWIEDLNHTKHALGEGERLDKRLQATKNRRAGIKGTVPDATAEGSVPSLIPPVRSPPVRSYIQPELFPEVSNADGS